MQIKNWQLSGMIILGLSLVNVSCESSSEGREDDDAGAQTEVQESPQLRVSAFSSSPAFETASLSGGDYKDSTFIFEVENYELGQQTDDASTKMCANSGKGQHIHLIVDDKPYAAKYTSSFNYGMEDGTAHVLAFLGRSYHESIKSSTAYVANKMTFEQGVLTASEPIEEPMLFYSRPKGTYVGKANTEKVMLDYYVINMDFGKDYKVEVEVNGGKGFILDKWEPIFLEGLPMGENTVKLTLLDNEGNMAATPNNPVERVFTLAEDPIENQ